MPHKHLKKRKVKAWRNTFFFLVIPGFYLSRWCCGSRWDSSLCRGGLRHPNQLLKHAEHGLARRGLQTRSAHALLLLRNLSYVGSQALKSVRGSSAVFVSHPNNRLRQLNFLVPLIPSGHSPFYCNRSGIWPPIAVHNKVHLNDLMTFIWRQIHTIIITIPSVFFDDLLSKEKMNFCKKMLDWPFFPLQQAHYYFYHWVYWHT